MKTKKVIELLQKECTKDVYVQRFVIHKALCFKGKPKNITKTEIIEELHKNDFGMIVPEVEAFINRVINQIIT